MRRSYALLSLPLALALPLPAHAVDIVVDVYDCGFPHPNDPTGTRLLAIAEEAADQWERVLPDNGDTYTIEICWDDLGPGAGTGATLGDSLVAPYSSATFNFNADFFMDPTPEDNSEFNMGQVLVQDLTAAQAAASYNDATPPDWLEAGFVGNGNTPDSSAKADLLSTVLHEFGHIMGVNYSWSEDYDLYPQFVSGQDGIDITSDVLHIADPFALMSSTMQLGQRKLISATDVFAVADDEDFDEVFLDRVDLLGPIPGTDQAWELGNSWEGGQVPDFTTSVNVRAPAWIFVNGSAGDLTIREGGEVVLFPGALKVKGALTTAEAPDGVLVGRGSVEAGSLSNSGAVIADDDGSGDPLFVHVSGDCDLDGTAAPGTSGAMLDAFSGDLLVECDTGMTDVYGGLLTVGAGRLFSFGGGFVVGALGEVHLLGAVGDPAVVEAKAIALRSDSVLRVTKDGLIDAVTSFDDSAIWFSNGARLDLLGETAFASAHTSSTKRGTLRQVGDLTVKGESSISVDTYDWDGDGDSRTDVIGRYAIEANSVCDTDGCTGFIDVEGHVSVEVGDEKALTPWAIGKGGVLDLDEDGIQPRVSGSDIVVKDGGTISGHGEIWADVTSSGTVSPRWGKLFGTISMDNFTQTKGAILEIDIDAKGGCDRVSVDDGVAELGGTLVVRGESPEVGQEYWILDAQTVKAGFTTLDLPKLEKGSWKVSTQTSGAWEWVVLSVVP